MAAGDRYDPAVYSINMKLKVPEAKQNDPRAQPTRIMQWLIAKGFSDVSIFKEAPRSE